MEAHKLIPLNNNLKNKIFSVFIFFVLTAHLYPQVKVKFAVIGDFGRSSVKEYEVSQMVRAWNPEFIITGGDNNYEYGADSTIDSNIGKYYHDFIFPYFGFFGSGANENKFFPSLGNHDWLTRGAIPYLNYFTLPGNERYYDFAKGNVHFFVLDSDPSEPDGTASNSPQALWLQQQMASAPERFKIVYFHHPPYSSGLHGNNTYMQWQFKKWGADAVICGHDHNYERIVYDGLTYFVNGLGGKDYRDFGVTVPGSRIQFTNNFGAQLVTAYPDSINFKFYSLANIVIDDTTLIAGPIGIHTITNRVPAQFILYQNYPNPFNPSTKIRFDLPEQSSEELIKLVIYDILGKEVFSLNEKLNPGKYEFSFNAVGLPSGIYFYSISTGSFFQIKKMILIK